jgi:hypothetical protein
LIFSDKQLAEKLERAEGRANASFVEARGEMYAEIGAEWIDVGGTYAMFDGPESPLTQTFGLGMFSETTNEQLDEVEGFFKRHEAPVMHEVSPMTDPSLMSVLSERGYRPIELTNVMFQELAAESLGSSANSGIVTRVIEKGEEKLWAKTSAAGWGTEMEGLADFMFEFGQVSAICSGGYPYLAELNGEPIAAGMLFVYDDVALLAGASTVPTARRLGAQGALLSSRLRFAAELGCTIAEMCAQPGSQSHRNAEKNGFRVAYTRTKWMLVGLENG